MNGSGYPLKYYPSENGDLVFLTDVLRSMFEIMDRYLADYDRPGQADRPFFYNERATLSQFAGGVWRSNRDNFVLEEYCANKVCETGAYKGRFDIWFKTGGQSCWGEAKQIWPSASAFDEDDATEIVGVLRAETDIAFSNVQTDFAKGWIHHAFGIVFVAPCVKWRHRFEASEHLRRLSDYLNTYLQSLTARLEYVVIRGSYFPDHLLTEQAFSLSGMGYLATYPGVEVLLCEKRKA